MKLWLPTAAIVVSLVPTGCNSSNVGTPATPLSIQPNTHNLCEKLIKGKPNVHVKIDCSSGIHKELNAELCYKPLGDCYKVPESATVRVTEVGYSGPFTAADVEKSLPSKIRHSLHFTGQLCGDEGTSSPAPKDVIDVSPKTGGGPASEFTVTDEGTRTKYGSGSDLCNIVFYDDADRFVEFKAVMI